jgi:hypothetical protein
MKVKRKKSWLDCRPEDQRSSLEHFLETAAVVVDIQPGLDLDHDERGTHEVG